MPVTLLCVHAGFDLCEVGQEEVVLKTGKLANRRTLHFALQSLLALFGNYAVIYVVPLSDGSVPRDRYRAG